MAISSVQQRYGHLPIQHFAIDLVGMSRRASEKGSRLLLRSGWVSEHLPSLFSIHVFITAAGQVIPYESSFRDAVDWFLALRSIPAAALLRFIRLRTTAWSVQGAILVLRAHWKRR